MCGHLRDSNDRGPVSAFYTLATVADAPADMAESRLPTGSPTGTLYQLETRFVSMGGDGQSTLSAPRLTVQLRQQGSINILNRFSYVETFTVEYVRDGFVADPQIGVVEDGLSLAVRVDPTGARGAVKLAFHGRVAEAARPLPQREVWMHALGAPGTIQLPKVERASASGVRTLETGVLTHIARLGRPAGGTLDVLVRVTELRADHDATLGQLDDFVNRTPAPQVSPPPADQVDLAGLMAGVDADVRIEIRAIRLDADLVPGAVLDEDAAQTVGGRERRHTP